MVLHGTESTMMIHELGVARVNLGRYEWLEVSASGLQHCFSEPPSESDPDAKPEVSRLQVTHQPIGVAAHAVPSEADGEYGLLVRYRTIDGRQEERIIPRALLTGPGKGLVTWVGSRGVTVDPKWAGSLQRYFALANPDDKVIVYDKTGWQTSPSGRKVFVLGGKVLGADEPSILRPEAYRLETVRQAGTLDAWLEHVAKPACQVPWWRFAMMASFAAPLLELLGEHSRGFHVFGQSSRGKTIGAAVAASVFGKGTKGDGFMSTWSATGNGIEALAEQHSDLPMILDELGQADGKDVGNVTYMLSNNAGKARMSGRRLQRRATWNTILISTGELSLAEKLRQAKKKIVAGMSVRFLELPIRGTGFVKQLDVEVARKLERACTTSYGAAGATFVERLVQDGYPDPSSLKGNEVRQRLNEVENHLVGVDFDNRHRRAARAFALVQIAGELAVRFGLVPEEADPAGTCTMAYEIWRDGGRRKLAVDAREIGRQLLDEIRNRIGVTLVKLGEAVGPVGRVDGWIDGRTVYLLGNIVEEVLDGGRREEFLRVLGDEGVLVRGDGKNLASRVPVVPGRPRAYRVDLEALEAWVGGGRESVAA